MILLALLLIAAILIAGVSSINKGSSAIFFDVSKNWSNWSSDILPRLISFDPILACSEIILVDNCSDDISREKNATEDFLPLSRICFAALNAMFVAKDVLPIEGRPAIIIKSELWNPPSLSSRSLSPVGTPTIPPSFL